VLYNVVKMSCHVVYRSVTLAKMSVLTPIVEWETTTGVPIEVKQEAVKRVVGDPHEIVTIRYSR